MGSSSSKEDVKPVKKAAESKPQRNFEHAQYDVLRQVELNTEATVKDKMKYSLNEQFVQRELLRRVALECGQRCVDYSSSKTFDRGSPDEVQKKH